MSALKPTISIIIPIYNAEKTILDCINSVLCSTFTDYEIICVDDGSTDCSVALLRNRYRDFEHIHIFSKPNGGVSSARNFGIKKANGCYCVFLDSDDQIADTYLSCLFNAVIHADLSICGYYNVKDNIKIISAPNFSGTMEDFVENHICEIYKNGVLFSPWNKMFRLDIIQKYNIHFNEQISILEDADFCFHYIFHCKTICSINDSLYYYNVGGGRTVQ